MELMEKNIGKNIQMKDNYWIDIQNRAHIFDREAGMQLDFLKQ